MNWRKCGRPEYIRDFRHWSEMFHKAINLEFNEGTELAVTFQDGKVMQFDMADLFGKYPQLAALRDRELFLSGKLEGPYGIVWNDELDLEVETVYEEGLLIRQERPAANIMVGEAVLAARARKGYSQTELSKLSGIDQSDISKIERGVANPSVDTLDRIAKALDASLIVSIA